MHAFKLLIDVFEPISFRACATASMREASNGEELVRQIQKECGLKIEIISGKEEAELIYSNHVEEFLSNDHSYLYIDVGGGSTELTIFDKMKIVASNSFNIGTIRWLEGKVNKIFKMLGRKDKPLPFPVLKELYDEMKIHSVEERMEIWGLNPDRADVIVPAAKIFLGVMKAAQIEEIIVPQIGLADGIIHQLHEQNSRLVQLK